MHYLVFLGAAVNLYGIAFYIRDIFHGQTRPNLVTWVLWAIAPLVASAAAFSTGARLAVLPTFMIGFGPLLVVVSAFIKRNTIWQPTPFSYLCGGLSLIALLLWALTRKPEIAVIFAILSDALAALPTLKKAWRFPETESGIVYTTQLFNILTSFAVIQFYTFPEIGFPIYGTLLNVSLSIAVYKKLFEQTA
ncbi:MAG TPA: hypothetical protein VNV88_12320 [Candidatus Solibacter sp.]|jgi:hypothetical protein|nr:hypothetical protein [Candidatus Solibacter sp.]